MKKLLPKYCVFVLWGMVLAIFLVGCGTPYYNQANITKGLFEINVPQNFTGAGKNFSENTVLRNFSLALNFSPHSRINMRGVWNDKLSVSDYDPLVSDDNDHKILPKQKIEDFKFKRGHFPLEVSYTHMRKYKILVSGYSFGLGANDYARLFLGINKENFELGIFGDIGFSLGEATFDYQVCDEGAFREGWCEDPMEGHIDEESVLMTNSLVGTYGSVYWNGIGLSYSASIFVPGLKNEYERIVKKSEIVKDKESFYIRVQNGLFLLNQYMGASTWIGEHWKFSVGATALSNLYLDEFYWTANTSVGYWF